MEEEDDPPTTTHELAEEAVDPTIKLQIPTTTTHQKPLTPSPATTPEPTSLGPQSSSSSILTSWYSLTSANSTDVSQDSKTYKAYVQSIDKCLKNFEYSIEWPDLISALTKLNKVISSFNTTTSPSQQAQQQPSQQQQQPAPPLPRTTLITKRLSQCLHPNLPSGVHLKTLETFDLIFKGFKAHDYIHLEADLFSFTSGLLPLWSYAAISVKPKLLSIYENHLVGLGERLRPALPGIMLSLFNGLVDDGVEQDVKLRIHNLFQTLQSTNPQTYTPTLISLVSSHPSIHLPLLTHMSQINYTPPPTTLMSLISSPNTLVQRNALELLLKSYDIDSLQHATQVMLTKTVLQSLLKRDMSITRRVFTFIEPRQGLVTEAIESLIQDPLTDGQSLTRVLSSVLDNQNMTILDTILPPVVKYLMKCEYTTSISFLSTISSAHLSAHFTAYLFSADSLEELENRVIVFNYVVKLRLFEFDWESLFSNLKGLEDPHLRVVLQMVRLHYNGHHDSFIPFYNEFMGRWFRVEEFEMLGCGGGGGWFGKGEVSSSCPPALSCQFSSSSFEFVCELMQKSEPDELAKKYIVLSSCVASGYTDHCVQTFIRFQDALQPVVYNTHATFLVFKHCYDNNKSLLNSLKYPEKYLLSELHSDKELRQVISLDLSSSPLVVLKLVDPVTMGSPYRRFLAKEFVRGAPGLVISSILRYLEFQVESGGGLKSSGNSKVNNNDLFSRAKSESNLVVGGDDSGDGEVLVPPVLGHAASVVNVTSGGGAPASSSCYYDSARVSTLLEKLEFVIEVHEEFLRSIDLVVLLSKLTVLSTIQNCNEVAEVTLEIQTRALRLIGRIVRGHGEAAHSFVYDSLLSYLSGGEVEVLWELGAVDVICEFFRFDLENCSLALVVQKCLSGGGGCVDTRQVQEAVHVRWLRGIGGELGRLQKNFNAVVLITFTNVCRNLLEGDRGWSDHYGNECVMFLDILVRFVLGSGGGGGGSSVGGSGGSSGGGGGGGFLSSLFGGGVSKDSVVDEREALRTALLGKVDLVVRICCKWWRRMGAGGGGSLNGLFRFLLEFYEAEVLVGVCRCFEVVGLEVVCRDMKVGVGKVCGVVIGGSGSNVLDGINFLVRYLKHDNRSQLDVSSIVSVCRLGGSVRHTLMLVTEYLRCGGGGKVVKELQDLVVRTIEMGVERREFWVLESYVPGVFDLVWGGGSGGGSVVDGGGGGDEGSGSISSLVSSASNASVRDQKVIVSTVHGVVVAVLVAVKGSVCSNDSNSAQQQHQQHSSSTSSNNKYTSALKVLEQISHHSYLRKAWKKEIFDLITNEVTFFYFTPECLAIWKVIVDNLFTQDRSTFSELITRLTQTTQLSSSALSLFSSKDSELFETRATLLKRLAFVIHSSEKDQYAKYITHIQEKIAEGLKIGNVGGGVGSGGSSGGGVVLSSGGLGDWGGSVSVSNSVFLCFRVMVVKFNANILVSLWPIIVHEVVMVLNSLQTHLDALVKHRESSSGDDESPPPPPLTPLLSLYLQTLKLLNFLFTIPSSDSQIPHFQLYKWAFTEGASSSTVEEQNNNVGVFVPYVTKLIETAVCLFPELKGRGVAPLRMKAVGGVEELCGGFSGLDVYVEEAEWEVVEFCDGGDGEDTTDL